MCICVFSIFNQLELSNYKIDNVMVYRKCRHKLVMERKIEQ